MPDTQEQTQTEDPNLAQLRERAEQGERDRAELEELKRRTAFEKAGIDPDSALGNLMFKSADVQELDPDKLKEQFQSYLPKPPDSQLPATQEQVNADKAKLQTGGAPGELTQPPVDRSLQAFKNFHAAMADPDKPMPREMAAGIVINDIFQRAAEGDKTVILDQGGFRTVADREREAQAR